MKRRTFLATTLAPSFLHAQERDPVYSVGSWPAEYGNHRARLRVSGKPERVKAWIPWRRHDDPSNKDLVLVEARSGKAVEPVEVYALSAEACGIAFQPPAAGEYWLYYLPNRPTPIPHLWKTEYTAPHFQRIDAEPAGLSAARLLDLQARTEFDRFDPMEVAATPAEVRELVDRRGNPPFVVFAEHRQHPVRMTRHLPLRWVRAEPMTRLEGEAAPGEFFVFQLAVFASGQPLDGVDVRAEGPLAFRCFNLGGRDWTGRTFKKTVKVPRGRVQTLWCGVEVPKQQLRGPVRMKVTVSAAGRVEEIHLALAVSGAVLEDGGDRELWRMSRLRWLDSPVGIEDTPTRPYVPLVVEGASVRCLNRTIRFGASGLPESIRSKDAEVLAGPVRLRLGSDAAGAVTKVTAASAGRVDRETVYRAGPFEVRCNSRTEFDGHIGFRLRLRATRGGPADVALEIPMRREAATYLMGMDRRGGLRPKEWEWKWNVNRANNAVWVGSAEAGLMCKLKGPKDVWEILDLKTSGLPESWNNGGRGGCRIADEGDHVLLRAFTGERTFAAGEELELRFSLLVTPVKPLDPDHWKQRYFHIYAPPEEAAAKGASIINLHHGFDLNPNINYPFLQADKLAAYVNEAHGLGMKVKIYYTVRELTSRLPELWALRSLGTEIFQDGPGGGHSWLCEHLEEHYAPAWHHRFTDGDVDASIATTGLSRWHNYYLEGLAWLVKSVGIDGLYIDGVGYDREVMKRVRRVLDKNRAGCLIDFHSGNSFDYMDLRVSPAVAYMEHFPYMNSLWFGEAYDYDRSPDYWLAEISGIPFGLFSEMLERNGNPWRGMVYGMTARYYQGADPRHMWKLWDDFGIEKAAMHGYWDAKCPVKTGQPSVLATAYVREKSTLVALASWDPHPVQCRLEFARGVTKLTAPEIPGFQPAREFTSGEAIPVEPGRGWLLICESRPLNQARGMERNFRVLPPLPPAS